MAQARPAANWWPGPSGLVVAPSTTTTPRTMVTAASPRRWGNASVAYSVTPSAAIVPTTAAKSQIGARKISARSSGMATAAVANLARSTQAFPLWRGSQHAPEAPLALLELVQRVEELRLAEIRPQRVREVDLGVRALPEEKVRDAHLATGAHEEVGVR